MKDMKRNVLWIDDEWEKHVQFIKRMKRRGIEPTLVKTAEEGLIEYRTKIFKWHGIILDGHFGIDSSTKEDDTRALTHFLDQIKDTDRKIPIFVYSGYVPNLKENESVDQLLNNRNIKYYSKHSELESEQLIEDVLLRAKGLLDVQSFVNLYPTDEIKNELEEYFTDVLEAYDEMRWNDDDVMNKIRKILEILKTLLEDIGLHGEKDGLTEMSKHLCDKKMLEVVPSYIQVYLRTLVQNTHKGSHFTKICSDIKTGRAPFLVQSSILELFSILTWFDSLPKDERSKTIYKHLSKEIIRERINKEEEQTRKEEQNGEMIEAMINITSDGSCYCIVKNPDMVRAVDQGKFFTINRSQLYEENKEQ